MNTLQAQNGHQNSTIQRRKTDPLMDLFEHDNAIDDESNAFFKIEIIKQVGNDD